MAKSVFSFLLFLVCFYDSNVLLANRSLTGWSTQEILQPTERQPARTAVLIIQAPIMGNCFVENRWKLGKKTWEQYMNSHPNVDCYFIKSVPPDPARGDDQVWLQGNTIFIGDWWYEKFRSDRILYKTIAAMKWLLPNYTHFIRTNLNVFLNLKNVNEYMETHHQSFYTTPLWQSEWYTIGYSIMFTADVAKHIVNEFYRLDEAHERRIDPNHSDDAAITSLATGVWPYDHRHRFNCCPALPPGVRQLMCRESLSTSRLSKYGALLTPPITLDAALTTASTLRIA